MVVKGITGRVFHINPLNEKAVQVVIKKSSKGKQQLTAFEAFGYVKDVVVRDLKLKKNDKIRFDATLKSRLWNGKYYTDLSMKNVEVIPEEKAQQVPDTNEISFLENQHIIDEETGEILL